MKDVYCLGTLGEENVHELVDLERGRYFVGDYVAVVGRKDVPLLHVREQQRHVVDVFGQLQPVAVDDVALFARRGLGV